MSDAAWSISTLGAFECQLWCRCGWMGPVAVNRHPQAAGGRSGITCALTWLCPQRRTGHLTLTSQGLALHTEGVIEI